MSKEMSGRYGLQAIGQVGLNTSGYSEFLENAMDRLGTSLMRLLSTSAAARRARVQSAADTGLQQPQA